MQPQVGFETTEKGKIFFSFSEHDPSQKKIVIMSHGFRGSSIGPARTFVDFERILNANGISTLRFDQPCSGNSEGEYLNSSFNDWIFTTSHFAKKYLDLGYQVALLGQSMGATTTLVVAAQPDLAGKIPCVILWVPDAKSTFEGGDIVFEEGGQKYRGRFWQEASASDFMGSLDSYTGGIHLVYGDTDKYIAEDLRNQVIQKVQAKGQPFMVLPGQDHSPWEFDVVQNVYVEELKFLQKYFA